MTGSHITRRFLAPVVVAGALALSVSGCVTTASIEHKEDDLLAAGFMDHPANTAARQDMLARLPANTFVRNVKGDVVHYIYADPKACHCLYVGTQQAYGAYIKTMQAKNLADEQQLTAQEYSDPAWNWGAWGPWGGGWGWGFGRGLGW